MRNLQIKRTVFVVLLGVAAYIWWGNFQSFRDDAASGEETFQDLPLKPKSKGELPAVSYREPRTNPFRRYNFTKPSSASAVRLAPVPVEPLQASHKLKGIVGKGSAAQAVVQLPDLSSRILSVSDAVGAWKVKEIRELYVIFTNGKRYDTLFLDTHGL